MRLRTKDLQLAKSTKFLSNVTRTGGRSNTGGAFGPDTRRTPEFLIRYATDRLEAMGYKLRKKNGSKNWKHKRMTTTLRRTIWLGITWDSFTPEHQAATLMHELVHANQSKAYGFWHWFSRYVASSRFRFAMECQGYRETIRANRVMGASLHSLKSYADDVPGKFIKSYFIRGRSMKRSVRKHMEGIILLP